MRQYSSDPDAARALALLESEMVGGDDPAHQIKHLRTLLEKECKAQVPSPPPRSAHDLNLATFPQLAIPWKLLRERVTLLD